MEAGMFHVPHDEPWHCSDFQATIKSEQKETYKIHLKNPVKHLVDGLSKTGLQQVMKPLFGSMWDCLRTAMPTYLNKERKLATV